MEIEGLIPTSKISSRTISLMRSDYEVCTIAKSERDRYEEKGWVYIPSNLKRSIRMRRPKRHSVAFEQRVWALFAKMGFDYINEPGKFHLDYGTGLRKQIDVFAYDSEAILIIECKSAQKRRRVDYRKDIGELAGLINDLRKSAQIKVPGKQKIAFIFCTNNAILSSGDRTRLADSSIAHLNQDAIEYYEQLTDHLGPAAKYQLFGSLFAGQNIPGLQNRFPAIKGKVAGGHVIYSFCIDPKYLLKIGYILHRSDMNADAAQAYQRLIKRSRLKKIAKYIEDGGYFPNSIIINIETKRRKSLKFDKAKQIDHDGTTSFGILHLPKSYRSAFIIDGQHRLYAYALERSGKNHTIPVVAFHNLPEEEQARIFIDINHTQKSVPANLLQSLMAEFHWGSDNPKQALSALKTRLLIELATDDDSPLYDRIVLAEERKTETRCLTIHTLKSWGLDRVAFLGVLRGGEKIKKGYLEGTTNNETLSRAKLFLMECLKYIEANASDQWRVGSGEGGFIAMNIGVSALFRVIDDILEFLPTQRAIDPYSLSPSDLAKQVIELLAPVAKYICNLNIDERKKLRSHFGSGAAEKVQREFQRAIHDEFPEFCPEGLNDWIKTSSGQFNTEAYELGYGRIEPAIDAYIKHRLKEAFGEMDNRWWVEGIPIKVQKKCSERRIENRSLESDDHFLNILDYEEIIKANWDIFSELFTPPGLENAGKSRRLDWLKKFNTIRQKYTHPQRENVTESELHFLRELAGWLLDRIEL